MEPGPGGQGGPGADPQRNVEHLAIPDVRLVVKTPVSSNNWVGALDMPAHDDVGRGDVVHVEANQGEVVNIARDSEGPVHDNLGRDRLDVGPVENRLSLLYCHHLSFLSVNNV